MISSFKSFKAFGQPSTPPSEASSGHRGVMNYLSMPGRHRDEEHGSQESDSLLERGQRKVKRFWEGFVDFAFQGNILQLAFGLM